MVKKYIIDSNIFIQGKNFHYSFAFCQGFWDWVSDGHNQGVIFSIKKVRAELVKGDKTDEARKWAEKMPDGFFLEDTLDAKVMQAYSDVMQWSAKDRFYLPDARKKFSDFSKADAFLLAYAKAHGHIVVTQEYSNSEKKKEIPIPNAALKIGNIETIPIYELLKKHAKDTFLFKP